MKLSDPLLLADGTLPCGMQSAIGEQQWVTDFHCVFEVSGIMGFFGTVLAIFFSLIHDFANQPFFLQKLSFSLV